MSLKNALIIAPNFKRRLSGVTSTIVQLIGVQRGLGANILATGPGLPPQLPHASLWGILGLWSKPSDGPFRIWHARRNVEMIAGIFMRDFLGAPLKLVFTSAAQRQHKPFTKKLIGKMDGVISTSNRSAAFLDVPATIIRHGIDKDHFTPTDKASAKAALGFDPPAHLIGVTGRVRASKGSDLFIQSMLALLPKNPSWQAIIAGRVTAEHEGFAQGLKEKVAAAGLKDRVHFLGEVADVRDVYRALDIFVAPSRNEGFGLTPLEALASCVPVVTSTAGAYGEIVADGVGLVAPLNDGVALTEKISAIMDLSDAQRAKMGEAGRAHVTKSFSLEAEAVAINRIYQNIFAKFA